MIAVPEYPYALILMSVPVGIVPVNVPDEPPQSVSTLGTLVKGFGIGKELAGEVGTQSALGRMSPQGSLLFALNSDGVEDVVSVRSNEVM